MQILPFVTVILMVMGIITYARLEHFLDFQMMSNHYQPYMEKSQREGFNCRQKQNYKDDHLSHRDSDTEKVTDATRNLTFLYILNKSKREEKPEALKQHLAIAKELMMVLYANQPFFKEVAENPSLLDQLLNELMQAVDAKNEKSRIKIDKKTEETHFITRIQDLVKVELPSPNLNIILYRMLQSTEKESDIIQKEKQNKAEAVLNENDTESESNDFDIDEENCSKEGFFSLFDYITLSPGPNIRIFLAPSELLEAIYGKGSPVVEEIIKLRKNLANQIRSGKLEVDIANQQFENSFRTQTPNWLKDDILNFIIKNPGSGKKKTRADQNDESSIEKNTGKGKSNKKGNEPPKLSTNGL